MPHTGNAFASFYYNPSGTNYFYTNGIYMTAGITYSAALWYETEYYGYNNWSNLSILYGTTQTTTGLVTIASTPGPAVSNIYKSLSNTFTVPTTGLYYIAVKGVGSTASSAQYLSWDDLSITIPCGGTVSINTPTLTMASNNTVICSGDPINLTASGADTYTWNTGSNSSVINDSPAMTTTYVVVGTSTLTGCTNTVSQMITVNPAPLIYVITDKISVCSGSPAHLNVLGVSTCTWSTGSNNLNITVSPTVSTTYTAIGSNSYGCSASSTQMINVNPLPNVTAASSAPNQMCVGEKITLTASSSSSAGPISFQWMSNSSSLLLAGTSVEVSPNVTTIYTVTATDANGCQKSTTIVQNVDVCAGINQNVASSDVKVYPNPTAGEFTIEHNNSNSKTIEVVDITGKLIYTATTTQQSTNVSLKGFASGIYYAKIYTGSSVDVIKIVKQ
jgi:hypothetical protein